MIRIIPKGKIIYMSCFFSADIDGVIVAANRFADMGLKKELFRRLDAMDIPCVAIGESNGAYSEIFSNLRKEMKYSPKAIGAYPRRL